MDTKEHAQQIYSMILAATQSSGRVLPTAGNAKEWAELAWIYARAFEEFTKKQ